jgi:ABC-type transport system involved in multi-copper enzyme maturation permease subunit
MNLLPVARRELRLLATRRRTYYSRVVITSVVIVLSLGMLYAGFGGALTANSAGRQLFLTLSFIAAAYVLIDGATITADCLSREKRDGTLGLLFLSTLRGHDIVAGKLVSRAANSAYALLAALPALGIALFLGGVTGGEYFGIMLALLNGLFFAAAFGMLVSALCQRERLALILAVLGVVAFAVLLPGWGWLSSQYWALPSISKGFLNWSPAGAFLLALSFGTPGNPLGSDFAEALIMSHLLAWCFLALASVAVGRTVWNEPRTQRLLAIGKARPQTAPVTSFFRQHHRLEQNPLIWLGSRPKQRGLGLWPVLLILASVWCLVHEIVGKTWPTLPVYFGSLVILHLVLMFLVTLQACRGPSEDQRSGLIELLLTTPCGDDFYVRGRLLALKRQSFWPTLAVLGMDVVLVGLGCLEVRTFAGEWLALVIGALLLMVMLLADLYALSWVGFWQSLKVRNTSRALRNTFFYVCLLRCIVLAGILALLGIITNGQAFQSGLAGGALLGGYLLLFVLSVLHFCGLARSALQDELRELALGQ